ncbi:hypothetical protein DERP_015387 [Dermatophagoides pteronyssinus]|uniref:Uncharacterized protein n=1 Tax=Dermatophagoides pteronyssinus TaxID=6956 RepID=A0ABQ8IRD9_DERPT|nr:hypothetical protein DERP_015387 [Dermatophagoides pteronyssinus]
MAVDHEIRSIITNCSFEIAIIFSFLLTIILLIIILSFICYARDDLERKILARLSEKRRSRY